MLFIFARHGQTIAGSEGRYEGLSDSPLTGLGEKQAHRLGIFCKDMYIKQIYCSPLHRAFRTSFIVGQILGLQPIIDDRLKEVCYGSWEHMKKTDLQKEKNWEKRKKDVNKFIYPGKYLTYPGESYEMQYKRFVPFIDQCTSQKSNLLIISHKGILRCVNDYITHFLQNIHEPYDPGNNTVALLTFEKGKSIEYKTISL